MRKLRYLLGVIAPLVLATLVFAPHASFAATAPPPITVPFDHFTTGFELDGVHRDLPCESCHLNAVFKATPRNCGACHMSGSQFNATPKTTTHIPSTNNCIACHNTTSFRPQMHFDHAEVLGSCVSCHNGTNPQALGKNLAIHPKTSDLCEACHTVLSWNPPKVVDHTQIPLAVEGLCIICHNGVNASGQSKNHIKTTLECGDCHLTITWKGARFDHTGILSGCASCHNGVKSIGKQGSHMPTTNLCESCHTTGLGTKTPSWVPSKFDHTQMTVTTCATCHSGTFAIRGGTGHVSGKPVNHVPTIPASGDCGFCHGNTPAAESWDVIVASIPNLHTGFETTNSCAQCHGGQTFAGKPAPYTPMAISGISPTKSAPLAPPHIPVNAGTDCSFCHNSAYTTGGFGPATVMTDRTHTVVSSTCDTCHDTGKSFYVGSGTALQLRPQNHISSTDSRMVSGDCGQCHTTLNWKSSMMPIGHMPNPASQTCATCHTSSPNDYTAATLASVSILHTGITGNCALCHGDYSAALTWANNFTPKDAILTPSHIPYLSGTDCSSCHTTNYMTGGFGPTNMSAAKHAFVPSSCNTCHEAGLSFSLGASTPLLQGRPNDHLSSSDAQQVSGDCSACHNTTDWKSLTLPIGHMPNPGNQACAVCHTAIGTTFASYATLANISVLHTGISGNCSACHGNTTTPLTFFGTPIDDPKAAVLTPSHIPYLSGSDCSSCHTANYIAGGFGPTNMSAAKHAFVPSSCNTCHEAGLSFFMGTSIPVLVGRPKDHLVSTNPQMVTSDCSNCHQTTDWTSNKMPAGHMPNPGNQGCSVCHTAITSAFSSYATLASISVLHTGISGNCTSCHGGTTAPLTFFGSPIDDPKSAVLSPSHIPYLTGTECTACHAVNYVTGGFSATSMSAAKHAFVPTTCNTCHDTGTNFYVGATPPVHVIRPQNHILTPNPANQAPPNDCSQCHNTSVWTTPTKLPNNHMPIPGTQICTVCHVGNLTVAGGYATLAAIPVLHTGITTGCAQCHGGSTALKFYNNNYTPLSGALLAAPHIPAFTGTDCVSCHTPNYVTGGFGPMNMNQTTHAGVANMSCNSCHEANLNFFMGNASPLLQGRPTNHTAGQQVAPNDCILCHTTANWSTTVLPTGHMPNPANLACNVCHTAAPLNYTTLAANSVLHNGISGNCVQCHGVTPLTFYNHTAEPKSAALAPSHVPFLSGTDCGVCHSSTTYAAGTFGPMNMTQATHAFVATTCVTCHEKGLSFSMGAATPALQPRPSTGSHVSGQGLTSDCSVCHTTANWNTTSLPAGHMPNPANQACAVCHIAIGSTVASYATLASNSVLHTGITSAQCASCHGGTTAKLTWTNNYTPVSAVLAPAHIPYLGGTSCGTCHTGTSYAAGTFGPMNMTQATHAFVATTCVTCHEKGLSFSMGAASPALQPRPSTGSHVSGQGLTSDCSVCHTTANWNTTSLPTGHMPNPANQACAVCHTSPITHNSLNSNASLHTGIASGCIGCHAAPNATPPVYAVGFTPKAAAGLSPPHIPTGSTPCEACHNPSSFSSFSGTGMSSTKHTSMFAYIGTTCDACHDASSHAAFYPGSALNLKIRADKSPNHFVGRDCSGGGCHVTSDWGSGHAQSGTQPKTRSRIASVVNAPLTQRGQIGIGEPREPGVGRSGVGHSTAVTGGMTHAGITGNCISCHNGTLATGKSPTHIVSSNTCETCHSTMAWLPAHFDHQGVNTNCASCHNGVNAPGRPINHIRTSGECSVCHGTVAWRPVSFSHAGINATCQSCHNGIAAVGKQVQHVITTQDCSTCHNTLSWTLVAPPKPQLKPLLPGNRKSTGGGGSVTAPKNGSNQ